MRRSSTTPSASVRMTLTGSPASSSVTESSTGRAARTSCESDSVSNAESSAPSTSMFHSRERVHEARMMSRTDPSSTRSSTRNDVRARTSAPSGGLSTEGMSDIRPKLLPSSAYRRRRIGAEPRHNDGTASGRRRAVRCANGCASVPNADFLILRPPRLWHGGVIPSTSPSPRGRPAHRCRDDGLGSPSLPAPPALKHRHQRTGADLGVGRRTRVASTAPDPPTGEEMK